MSSFTPANETADISFNVQDLIHHIVDFQPSDRVVDFVQPEDLEKVLEDKLRGGMSEEAIQKTTDFILSKSLNTSHPFFLNQLYGAIHPVGLAATYLLEKMNTNQHTYEVAPVFVLTERIMLRKVRQLFYGREEGDGIFAPGGSIANMYAIVLARHRKFPHTKTKGIFGLPPLVVFTSQDSHYSVSKAAHWMGLGLENVVKVKTDKRGRMISLELEGAIKVCRESGKEPLIVIATAGTTVLGAFDPFSTMAEICGREGIWLHCDAAWGGSFIFSPRLREEYLRGIDKCDSVCWNAHKMLCAPLQCSAFITKEPDQLLPCNSLTASYLFQQDKFYPPEYDNVGDKSIQCGRKPDAFKLYYMWLGVGPEGFRRAVENAEDCARYIAEEVKGSEDFILHLDSHQCTNVFFWYVPPRLRDAEQDEIWWADIGKVTSKIKEKMVLDGRMMVGYAPLPHKGITNAFRLVLPAFPERTHAHMDSILNFIRELGQDL